jgi:hypothetical protein
MAEVRETKKVATPPDDLWEKVGDFHGMHKWFPGMQPTESINDGKARKFDMGTSVLIEELVDQGERWYSYAINDGPLPVKNYVSTLKVSPEGDGSLIEWSSTFDPADGTTEEQAIAVITGVYQTALGAL